MYFDECFYDESFTKEEKTDTKRIEHGYYQLKSGEWLCLTKEYKAVKKEWGTDWEVSKCDSSVSKDKPGEPGKEEYIDRLVSIFSNKDKKKVTNV